MKCSVFIATSVDGFIAKKDGSIDWLTTAGKPDAAMGDQADMGFNDFIQTVDCLIMGRNTMEIIAGFPVSNWPYGDRRIIVLSKSLKEPPAVLKNRVTLYSGDILKLITILEYEGYHHAYIDGGKTIQSFLALHCIQEITVTKVPILLGEGIPLFGPTGQSIYLEEATATTFPNDYIQCTYKVRYQ